MSQSQGLTIADCLRQAASLAEVSDTARLDVEVLLCHVLGKDRSYLFTWPEKFLEAAQSQAFEQLLARRRQGEPVAHLTGSREFWTLNLKVNPSTLIPRPETELLVELALEVLPQSPRRIVDLGTGTGAIALALASERPAWEIVAADKFADAVALAEDNRQRLGLDNVTVLQSDWFNEISPPAFDLVVSNPPYIDPVDPHLQQGDVKYEPLSALIAEHKGYADLRTIAEQAKGRLLPGGYLMMEHGFDQGEGVRNILAQLGYADVCTRTDLAGLDRVTMGRAH